MDQSSPLGPIRAGLRVIFQAHCEAGQVQITLQELLRFCVNVKLFPVSNRQDFASSQTIYQLASRIVGKSEDIKLSFGQFERFLRLFASSSLPGTQSNLRDLYAVISSPCERVYRVKLKAESSASLRSSFLELPAADSRLSLDSSPSVTVKRISKAKSMPKLAKRFSLMTTLTPSKAKTLKKIYTRPIARKITLFEPSPKSSTMRNAHFSEESASPSAAQTLIRPFFSRLQSRSGSISKDQLSRIKAAFGTFKTQMSAFIGRKPRPMLTTMHMSKILKRRIQPVNIHLESKSNACFSNLETEDSAQ